MVRYLYDDDYDIFPIYVDCCDQGHRGVARARVYCICAHKQRAKQLLDVHKVYDKVTKAITKQIRTRPRDYLVATHWEIMRNASLTASKRHMFFAPAPRQLQPFI